LSRFGQQIKLKRPRSETLIPGQASLSEQRRTFTKEIPVLWQYARWTLVVVSEGEAPNQLVIGWYRIAEQRSSSKRLPSFSNALHLPFIPPSHRS
jgi:hypothetical protein